jgi:hypothetical protein
MMADRNGAAGGVRILEVEGDEAGARLDRWFKRHFPNVAHGKLEKLLRTGQVRVDGRRAKSALRLEAGQQVRVPPVDDTPPPPRPAAPVRIPDRALDDLRASVLHQGRRRAGHQQGGRPGGAGGNQDRICTSTPCSTPCASARRTGRAWFIGWTRTPRASCCWPAIRRRRRP